MHQDGERDAERCAQRGGPVQAGAQDQREVRTRARQGDEMDETYGQKQAGEHGNLCDSIEFTAWRIVESPDCKKIAAWG